MENKVLKTNSLELEQLERQQLENYLENNVYPILSPLVANLIQNRPINPVNFFIKILANFNKR